MYESLSFLYFFFKDQGFDPPLGVFFSFFAPLLLVSLCVSEYFLVGFILETLDKFSYCIYPHNL